MMNIRNLATAFVISAFVALWLLPSPARAQGLDLYSLQPFAKDVSDVYDIAVDPWTGDLLVLARCGVFCESLDEYTPDGRVISQIRLTSFVNRILIPARNNVFVAYETNWAFVPPGTGLYLMVGARMVPISVPTPLDGQSNPPCPTIDPPCSLPDGPTNTAWTTGPDGAIYLLQTFQATDSADDRSVVMRIALDGRVTHLVTMPTVLRTLSVLDSGIYVGSERLYRFSSDGGRPVAILDVALYWPPVDGGDGFIYGSSPSGVVRMRPDGSDYQLLYSGSFIHVIVKRPGEFVAWSSDSASHCGHIFRPTSSTSYELIYDFATGGSAPPYGCQPSKMVVGPGGELYGAAGVWHSVFRFWSVDDSEPEMLLYAATTGWYEFRRELPIGATPAAIGSFGPTRWGTGWQIYPADFNGDGRRDLLFYNPVSGLYVKGINRGHRQFDFTVSYYWAPNWEVHIVDLNADGKSDLFLYNSTTGQWFAPLSIGDGTGDFDYTRSGTWATGWTVTVVDWQADRRDDLFVYNKASGLWVKITTLSDGSFSFPSWGYWAPGWNIYNADFDGDGRSELFLYANGGTAVAGRNFVVRAVGDTFEYEEGMRWGADWTVTIGDLDGDRRSDIFLYNPANGMWFEVFKDAGSDVYYSGSIAADWKVALLPRHGSSGDVPTDSLVFYNPIFTSPLYSTATPLSRGLLYFQSSANWLIGSTVIPMW